MKVAKILMLIACLPHCIKAVEVRNAAQKIKAIQEHEQSLEYDIYDLESEAIKENKVNSGPSLLRSMSTMNQSCH